MMPETRRRRRSVGSAAATIRDVARVSKVSIATVSRVFNDSTLVSGTTRQRVLASASRLGYWPNGIARSLITSRTHTLGVLMPDLHGEFFSEVIHGLDLKARERGFHILVTRASSNAEDLTTALRSMRGRVDGLIVMAPVLDQADAIGPSLGDLPTVLLNPEAGSAQRDSISIANREGARAVVRHLIRLGHRRIALITGPARNIDSRQRLEGYQDAIRESEAERSDDLVYGGDFGERSGYDAAVKILERSARPTAIFAANDYMAVGVIGALADAGLRMPEDMAVVGFDDIPLARYLTPPLTTVHVDMLQLGERAVDLLLDRQGPEANRSPRQELVPTTLVIRGSCGAPPPGAGESGARWNRIHPARGSRH
jgi:LacI family transcriptional regulator